MDNELEFKEITLALKTLKSVEADKQFKNKMYKKFANYEKSSLVFPLLRFALCILILILGLGSGAVVAAKNTHPGDLLYPVKKTVETVGKNLGFEKNDHEEEIISPTPTPSPTSTPSEQSPLPTLTPAPDTSSSIIIISSPTPTPTDSRQVSSVSETEVKIDVLGTETDIGQPSITPTLDSPTSQILDLDVVINKKPIIKVGL